MQRPSIAKNTYPLLALATLSVLLASCNSNVNPTTTMSSSSASDASLSSSVAAMINTKKYADGTYSAQGSYTSPAGQETEDVSLTLQNNIITNATFKGNAIGTRSQEYQQKFSEGFKEAVVGKSIDNLALTVVNGSSLTPMGFMDAVEKIKTQAAKA